MSTTRPSASPGVEREYVLGTGADELNRLGLQHRLWSAQAHRVWELAGVRPELTVLDVGCGPGFATTDLAQIVGGGPGASRAGKVIAVDESAGFLKHLHDEARSRHLTNIERVLADVQELDGPLAHAAGTVDVAYARWVFCFLSRPEALVASLGRLVKPGGRVAVQDYFGYEAMSLAPRRDVFGRIVHAIGASWRARGGDPDIVGRLPSMFRAHGFEITRLDVQQRIARPGSPMWSWPDSFWLSYVPRLAEMGFITREERDEFFATWREATNDPATFMVLPPVFDLIVEKR